MPHRKKNLFSSGSGRRGKRDYRNAGIGPDLGGYDAKGNARGARSIKRGRHAQSSASDAQGSWQAHAPGEIGYVRPRTTTGETAADHTRRRQRGERQLRPRRSVTPRMVMLALLALVAVVAVAAGVASCVYHGSVNGRMTLQDDDLQAALAAPADADAPYYVLLAGHSTDASQQAERADLQAPEDPDVLMLVRVEATAAQATAISIPCDASTTLSDGSEGFISHEYTLGGNAALVRKVAEFAGVDIAHFVTQDAAGFSGLVDALGGIEVDLSEEVDDPTAGSIYLPAGDQQLDGAQALVLARAKNYAGGYETRAQNQMKELVALAQKAVSDDGLGAQQGTLDAIAGTFQTDLTADQLLGLLSSYSGFSADSILTARVPGSSAQQGTASQFSVSENAWKSMMEKVDAGEDPNAKSEEVLAVKPADYTLTVLNGAGIDGVAGEAAEALKNAGYRVKDTGNTEQFAYTETLVVYKDDKNAPAAQAIVDTLGVGRAVAASIYYDFDTDLEVVVGQDWKPVS